MRRLYPCFLCEKRYAEIEDAEVCERSHASPVADVARGIIDAQRSASPIADVPFSLSSQHAQRRGKQNGLF